MEYLTKVIIDGVEVIQSTEETTPFEPTLTSASVTDSACIGTMEIGSSASNSLTITINNPYKTTFDGDRVEFYISPIASDVETAKERIENETESTDTDELVDSDDTIGTDDTEDGEDMTDEELLDVSSYDSEMTDLMDIQLEGEDDTIVDEETDESAEPEWVLQGVYFVYKQSNGDNSVTLTCYDNFSRMNGIYANCGIPMTYAQHWSALTAELSAINIELDPFEFVRGSDTLTIKDNTTQRETLGLLCGYAGGFATCDSDGSVGISYYAYADKILIDSELLNVTNTSAGEMLIDGIDCTDDRGYTISSVGGGQTVTFSNYLVTESILDEIILPLYRGMRFGGGTISAEWDSELVAGEFIRVMTEDEYRNYLELQNSEDDTRAEQSELGSIYLISTQTITFGGNATTVISSVCATESEKEKIVMSPTIKRIIEAGKTATNFLTEDDTGALVIRRDSDNFNVRIDADSVDIRDGDTVLASFGEHATFYLDESSPGAFSTYIDWLGFGHRGRIAAGSTINEYSASINSQKIEISRKLYNGGASEPWEDKHVILDINGIETTGKVVSNNIRSGSLSTSVPANSYKDYGITFDTPMTGTPYVTASLVGTATTTTFATNVNLSITGKSEDGFTIRMYNSTNGARNWSVNWIAIS